MEIVILIILIVVGLWVASNYIKRNASVNNPPPQNNSFDSKQSCPPGDRSIFIVSATWKAAVTHINNIGLPKDTHCLICIYSAAYYFIQPFLKVSFDEYHRLFVQVADISFRGSRSSKTLDELFDSQFLLLDLFDSLGLQPRDNQNDFKKMYRIARSCAEEMPSPPPFFPLEEELDFLRECSNLVDYISKL